MRIVLVSASADPVGVSTHVINLAKLLARSDLLELVVCPSDGWLRRKLAEHGLPCKVVPMGFRWNEYLASVARFFAVLRSFPSSSGAVVVHCHGRFPLLIAALPILFMRKAVFVATVHQFASASARGMAGWKNRLEAIMLRRVRRIWCVSDALRGEVVGRLGSRHAHRVETIHNWLEPAFGGTTFHRARVDHHAGFRICAIGRLSREKGFDLLVEAVHQLIGAGHDVVCDIFGNGPEGPRLQALIERLRVGPRITLRGSLSSARETLPSYDAVAIPSRSESFGIVALEAFDAGVPVVASGVPGLQEVVIHERTGLVFEAGNAGSMAATLERLMASRELASTLSSEASGFLRRFTPTDALRDQVIGFYNAALASPG